MLILLGTLAAFAADLTGLAAYALRIHREFQANTMERRLLSHVYLGLGLLRCSDPRITHARIRNALAELQWRVTAVAAYEIREDPSESDILS